MAELTEPVDVEPNEWLQAILERAVQMGVSDIFFDVVESEGGSVIRVDAKMRIDDEFIRVAPIEGERSEQVSNAIRQSAGISTGALITPGEGRYKYVHKYQDNGNEVKEDVDVRVTMYPVNGGQFISMRIPQIGPIRPLEQLGFSEYNLARLNQLLDKPGGLSLLSGPMGSGKTTTLYAAALKKGGDSKSVLTVEDPKERTLPGARQIEIGRVDAQGQGGMTYPKVLKSLLRVVIDVLLVGEIRDKETAEASIRIATAGARVLSSIHSDDPVTAIARVIAYAEAHPVNIMGGISGVASQRMIRLLCKKCQGSGCETCHSLGFRGKAPVHEVLINTAGITEAFVSGLRQSQIAEIARAEGMTSFHDDADRLLKNGLTTKQEIERTIGFDLRGSTTTNIVDSSPVSQSYQQPQPVQAQPDTQTQLPASRQPLSIPSEPMRRPRRSDSPVPVDQVAQRPTIATRPIRDAESQTGVSQ